MVPVVSYFRAGPGSVGPREQGRGIATVLERLLLGRMLLGRILLAGLLLLGGAASPVPAAESAVDHPPWRLGLHHPQPAFCRQQDPAQRDLLVLRLVYGLGRSPRGWQTLPGYMELAGADGGALKLRAEELWGVNMFQPLEQWRRAMLGLPGVNPGAAGETGFVVDGSPFPAGLLFLGSRLGGSKLLPVRDDEADKCRDWPRGVEVITGSGRTGYRLRVFTPGRHPLQIDAYVSWDALWEDLQGGKLDGVLAAEHDVREAPSWTRITRSRGRGSDAAHAVWLQMPGGQQIVVRLDRAEKLNPQSRRALSLAAPRQALVNLPGPGAFVPTEMFLAPLLNVTPAAPGLETDALEARKLWLGAWGGEENPSGEPVPESGPAPESGIAPESLQLLLPENPYLERLASLLADRWRRSLNLGLEIHPLGMTMFAERAAGAVSSLVLDVVDLDDGSLQDLWEKSLAGYAPGAGAPVTLENLELSLRERMPYVPLLRNVHYLVLPREGGKSRSTEDICPGCLPVPPPSPLDPPRPAPMPRDG